MHDHLVFFLFFLHDQQNAGCFVTIDDEGRSRILLVYERSALDSWQHWETKRQRQPPDEAKKTIMIYRYQTKCSDQDSKSPPSIDFKPTSRKRFASAGPVLSNGLGSLGLARIAALALLGDDGRVGRGALLAAADAALALEQLAEADGRVEEAEGGAGDDDHDALEADEEVLALHQGPVPAAAQLGDAEDAAPEDGEGGEGQGGEEAAELLGAAHADEHGVLVEGGGAEGAVAAERVDGEVGRDGDEDEQSEDLEGQAGDHDVVARLDGLVLVRGDGGHAATDCLEDEGDDVAGDELGVC